MLSFGSMIRPTARTPVSAARFKGLPAQRNTVTIMRRQHVRAGVAKPTEVPEVAISKGITESTGTKPAPPAAAIPDSPKADVKAPAAEKSTHINTEIAPVGTSAKDDVSGPMLEPSVFNTTAVRALAVTAAVVLAAASTSFLPSRFTSFLHLISFAVFLGTNIWNTFFVGLTLFKLVPRQVFGKIQAKLFPLYFALTTGAGMALLGTLLFSGAPVPGSVLATLALGVACNLVNWVAIEPICVKYMFERYDIENKEKKTEADTLRIKELYKQFGKWHGISSLLNLVVLVVGFAHGWHLTSAFVA